MQQEVAFLGLYLPSLLILAIVAGGVWLVADAVMLRSGAWRLFWHASLARVALYVILLAAVVALYPDF